MEQAATLKWKLEKVEGTKSPICKQFCRQNSFKRYGFCQIPTHRSNEKAKSERKRVGERGVMYLLNDDARTAPHLLR